MYTVNHTFSNIFRIANAVKEENEYTFTNYINMLEQNVREKNQKMHSLAFLWKHHIGESVCTGPVTQTLVYIEKTV